MVMIFKQGFEFHRKNAKGRRDCVVKKKKIPGPLGRTCVIPRPGVAIMKKFGKS